MFAVTAQAWRRTVLVVAIIVAMMAIVVAGLPVVLDGVSVQDSLAWVPWQICLWVGVVLLLFYFAACPLIGYARLKRQGLLGLHRFTLLDDGVRVESPRGETLAYWQGLKRVTATPSRLFLFVGPTMAFVLPRRAFHDPAEFDVAVADALRRYASSRR